MCDESNEERQDNELAALQAIYLDAVVDNRENIAWKVWRPMDLMLTLNPLHNSDIQGIHCSVTLHITCSKNYPDKPPSISIQKMHGISTENASKLLNELESLASTLCGEVMIFQLATHTQQFLHDHNKPTLSFYDEMLKQKTEMEKLKKHDLQVKENEERQKIKDEIQKRQEMLRGERRPQRGSISQESSQDGQGDVAELVYYADDKMSPARKVPRNRTTEVPCTCENKGVQVLRVTQKNNKKVYIGNCLGHSINGSTTYLAIDEETGERLITKKWTIPPVSDFQTRNKQLTSLQYDLKTTCRIKHTNLVPYTALELTKETNKRTTKQCIYIFRNFVLGTSLKYLKNRLKLSDYSEALRFLRHIGVGVLKALKELHSVGIVHRDVRSENVFLDEMGCVKLVGAALDARLMEMVDRDSGVDRQTSSQDIFNTGQLLLSLVAPERTDVEIPSELPSTAKDFFARCLTEDEHSQWTAEQLVNHVFLIDTVPYKEPLSKQTDADSGSEDEEAKKISHTSPAMDGHSRLNAEFEVLQWLGKGAFGDVLKVKNKLDGGFYAIKRIQLNPENVQLNKKITREVKLLSRLNHENVVRYYNAWIETTIEVIEQDVVSEAVTRSPSKKIDSLEGIVAKLGQEVKVEWSMSEGLAQKSSSDSEDDDDDDDQDPWFNIMSVEDEESSSEGVEFEQDSKNQSQTILSEDIVDAPRPRSERLNQVLYIQMEFCEKHTLRQAIDSGLYHEQFRAWRLFREIVEGLAHVHQRGMIHRDLKPVNIFLDSHDHVKIGDFGLATKAFTGLPLDERSKQEDVGGSLTGQIGTALYVAPELLQSATKVIYNQKVDIYSLGIILFEMFHPLATGMERMAVLTDLRNQQVIVPKQFDTEENAKQIHVVRWLLNHEPSLRPTCQELLASEHVPRPVPEGALSGLLSHALSDRTARGYQRLISACLEQRSSPAEDYTYHSDVKRPADMLPAVKDVVIQIFRSHGAVEFAPPLLTPRSKVWDQHLNAVKVMTASGSICHLPHDLRLPFARHTAYSAIKQMRRYCIDRVYRERHVQGFHPREILECAFDIVTPKTDMLWSDAELLVVASRCATACSLKVSIQLNHSELLRTLLLSCGVSVDKHVDIYPVLVDVSLGRITNLQLQTHLTSLCISSRDVTNLVKLMESEVPVSDVKELVVPLVSRAGGKVGRSISHLDAVCRQAVALGCQCPLLVAPLLAYNATQHNGVFWQMCVIRDEHTYKGKHKHRSGDIIAAGGRYDALVEEFWKVASTEKDHENSQLQSSSVGFSMSLERMAAILKKMDQIDLMPVKGLNNTIVYVTLSTPTSRLVSVARGLWSGDITCCISGRDHSDTRPPCVTLQEEHHHTVRILVDDGHRVREHKVPFIDVLDFVKQQLNPDTPRLNDGSRSISWTENEKSNGPIISVTFITASDKMTKNAKKGCESQINSQITSILVGLGLQPVLNRVRVCVVAVGCDETCVRQLAAHLHHPPTDVALNTIVNNQITSILVGLGLQPVLNRVRVCVVAVGCDENCVRQLAAHLHHPPTDVALNTIVNNFPKKQNIIEEAMKELSNIVKQNNQTRSNEEIQLYALYSIPDSLCRLIT